MEKILVLGAGKSSYYLINYLAENSSAYNYELFIADASQSNLEDKVNSMQFVKTVCTDLSREEELSRLIEGSAIVVSLLPPFMHFTVAKICLKFNVHLLTASYLTSEIFSFNEEAKARNLTFIMECGLDPGLDHMSAMQIFDKLRLAGATVHTFRSSCGGLIAPESDNNPWGYKITWNPKNVILAGKGTASYLENGSVKYIPYHQLFKRTYPVQFESGEYEAYPNRDSILYIETYQLKEIKNFLRGTIRKKGFSKAWNEIVQLGLTDDQVKLHLEPNTTVKEFVNRFLPGNISYKQYLNITDEGVMEKLNWLGFGSSEQIGLSGSYTASEILQSIAEKKWKLENNDKDLVLMQHEFGYTLNGKEYTTVSSLTVEGESQLKTAMSKTVGLPLAVTTLLLFRKKIDNKGVTIPVLEEIYNPVLEELHNNNLIFREYTYS